VVETSGGSLLLADFKRLPADAVVRLELTHCTACEHARDNARVCPKFDEIADLRSLGVGRTPRPDDERASRAAEDRVGLVPLHAIVHHRVTYSVAVRVDAVLGVRGRDAVGLRFVEADGTPLAVGGGVQAHVDCERALVAVHLERGVRSAAHKITSQKRMVNLATTEIGQTRIEHGRHGVLDRLEEGHEAERLKATEVAVMPHVQRELGVGCGSALVGVQLLPCSPAKLARTTMRLGSTLYNILYRVVHHH